MATVKFNPDKVLFEELLHAASKAAQQRDVKTGDILLTFMAAAKEWIKAGKLAPEAETMVQATLIQYLADDRHHAKFRFDRWLRPEIIKPN